MKHDGITGRYMSLPFLTARTFWLKRTDLWLALGPAPAPAGDFRQLADHGFCQRDYKQITL